MEELAGEKSGLVGLSALSEDEEQSLELFESVEQEEPVRRGWLKCKGQRNYFDLEILIQGIHYLLRYIVRQFNPVCEKTCSSFTSRFWVAYFQLLKAI